MFSKAELEVMSRLLEMASEEFSNHGCNEFELPATEVNIALITQADDDGDGPHIQHNKIIATDFALMSYFEKRCKEELAKLP